MTSKNNFRTVLEFILILAFAAVLAGCKGSAGGTPAPAATTAPSPTSVPAELILVDKQGSAASDLTGILTQFTNENSLQFRTTAGLTVSDVTSGVRIVVFTTDPGNITDLSAAAPSAQFVVLGENSIRAAGNISTVKSNPVDRAFMAGYLTMLLAQDWRAAGLIPSDTSIGNSYYDAFVNGAEYVCGKCNPFFAPLKQFPVVATEPAASDAGIWASDAAELGADWLSTAFIDPAAANVAVANGLVAHPINYESVTFIGYSEVSPDSGLTWDVLLSSDAAAALKDLLPKLLAGQGGQQADAVITLDLVNPDAVSPARQQLFNDTAAKLASGELEPLSVP